MQLAPDDVPASSAVLVSRQAGTRAGQIPLSEDAPSRGRSQETSTSGPGLVG